MALEGFLFPAMTIRETQDFLVFSSLIKLRKLLKRSRRNDSSTLSRLARAVLINRTIECLLQKPDPRYRIPVTCRLPPLLEDINPEIEKWVRKRVEEIENPRKKEPSEPEDMEVD
uniref:Uncharacterized protein n=1 Tax=Steinernema glaseri TaxID=37863 RepID=A0A1I8A0I3_9BILA